MTINKPSKKALANARAKIKDDEITGVPLLVGFRRPPKFSDEEWKFINEQIDWCLHGVKEGRSTQATGLIQICAAFLRAGEAPPEAARAWLTECLESLASNESPWGVPFITRKRGQKNADDWMINLIVASYYDQLRSKGEKAEVAWRLTKEDLSFLAPDLTKDKIENYSRKLRKENPSK